MKFNTGLGDSIMVIEGSIFTYDNGIYNLSQSVVVGGPFMSYSDTKSKTCGVCAFYGTVFSWDI